MLDYTESTRTVQKNFKEVYEKTFRFANNLGGVDDLRTIKLYLSGLW
jgi:hypothetical protein